MNRKLSKSTKTLSKGLKLKKQEGAEIFVDLQCTILDSAAFIRSFHSYEALVYTRGLQTPWVGFHGRVGI